VLSVEKPKHPIILDNLSQDAGIRHCFRCVGVKITWGTVLDAILKAIYVSQRQSTLCIFNFSCAIPALIDKDVSALPLQNPIFRGL